MSDISRSAFEDTPEFKAAVEQAAKDAQSPTELASMLSRINTEFVAAHGGVRSNLDPNVIIDTHSFRAPEPSTAPKFEREMTINGVTQRFAAETEAQLWKEIASAYEASHNAQPQQTPQQQEEERQRLAREEYENGPKYKADLEIAWRTGAITSDEYLLKSGALDKYARERLGIDPQEIQTQRDAQPWIDASSVFLQRHENDWPGGSDNLAVITDILESNEHLIAGDPLDALEQAYQYARENHLLNDPVGDAKERIKKATTPEELRAAALSAHGRTDSGVWGGR